MYIKRLRTMKRIIKMVLLVILVAPLAVACCNEETYEITISGLETRTLIPQGTSFIEYDKHNSIDKDELFIELNFTEIEDIVSGERGNNKITGPAVLQAAVVPCPDQVLIYTNRVERITVEVLDADNNNERLDVTDQMVVQGTEISLSEFIAQSEGLIGDFLIGLSDTANIPDRIIYTIEATLDDGAKLESSDGIINFN